MVRPLTSFNWVGAWTLGVRPGGASWLLRLLFMVVGEKEGETELTLSYTNPELSHVFQISQLDLHLPTTNIAQTRPTNQARTS